MKKVSDTELFESEDTDSMNIIYDTPDFLNKVLACVKSYGDIMRSAAENMQGPRLFPGQINVYTRKVPALTPDDPGMFADTRDNGGSKPHCCNLLFDLGAIDALDALSDVTGNANYSQTVTNYLSDLFSQCLYPGSDYIPWGEHVGYNIVTKGYDYTNFKGNTHEVKFYIIPWERFWNVSKDVVINEIAAAFKNHIISEKDFRYNRHASMEGTPNSEDTYPCSLATNGGLYMYSWAWLYKKTGDEKLLDWADGMHAHYWNKREKSTGLFCTAEDRPYELWYIDVLDFAAFLMAAWNELKEERGYFREHALAFVESYTKYAYNPEAKKFYDTLNTKTGEPVIGPSADYPEISRAEFLEPWINADNSCQIGQIACTCASMLNYTNDERLINLFDKAIEAIEIEKSVKESAPMYSGTVAGLIHTLSGVYKLTGKKDYLDKAALLVNHAMDALYHNGLFAAATSGEGGKYYFNRMGSADLANSFMAFWNACNNKEIPKIRNLSGLATW